MFLPRIQNAVICTKPANQNTLFLLTLLLQLCIMGCIFTGPNSVLIWVLAAVCVQLHCMCTTEPSPGPRTPTAAAVHTRILPIGGMRRHPPVPTWVPSEQPCVISETKLQLKTSSCRIWLLDSVNSIPWSLKSITCILQSLFCYKCYHHECCCYLMNPFHGVCPT